MTFDEFQERLKDKDLCLAYRIKFNNKYADYIKLEDLQCQQYTYDNGIKDFELTTEYDTWQYEWFSLVNIEPFFTAMDLDYSKISSRKSSFDFESDEIYVRYEIQDVWNELDQIHDDIKFCYGIYLLINLLNDTKQQNRFKYDLQKLLNQLLTFKSIE